MAETEPRKFTFTDASSEAMGMPGEVKKIRALEYIAHYLEGIDASLAKIAATLTEDPANDVTVMRALQDIAEGLKRE
jgi:hypothetical protein